MFNFFRKIRLKLANENQFVKYGRYAIGEIVLVMVGILLALQVNNWNERRKQDAEFAVVMEQIYNTLSGDVDFYKNNIAMYNDHIVTVNYLLDSVALIDKYAIPYVLHGLTIVNTDYVSESAYHTQNIEYSQSNKLQNAITKQLISYADIDLNFEELGSTFNYYKEQLREINLAYPKVNPDRAIDGWVTNDSTYYSTNDLENSLQLLQSDTFRANLKTLRTVYTYQLAKMRAYHSDGLSLIKLIKKHFPDVKLLFMDVGVKGTAIDGYDNVYGPSTPMKLTDIDNEIWEVDIYLFQGRIKFRCRDSWAVNWGGDDFPNGKGHHDGPDIIIPEEGMYHIVFKPVTGEYEFTLIENQE